MKFGGATGLLALAAALSSGCKREETPARPPGLLDSEGRPIVVAPPSEPPRAAPAPEPPAVYDFEQPSREPAPSAAQNLGMHPPASTGGSAQAAGAGRRDLPAELSSALNQLTDCVDPAQAAKQPNGRLVIAVSASVMGTGSISRATIEAPGQPPEALACLQRGALALKLAEPVPGAPLNVKGRTEVEVKAVGPKPAAAAPQPPSPPTNPDVARSQPDDMARPDPADLAGPP